MKKYFSICCILFSLQVFAQKPTMKPSNTVQPAIIKLTNATDTMQYILGAYLAQWMNTNGFAVNNPTIFLRGMDDVLQNKQRTIPDSIITPAVNFYQQAGLKAKSTRREKELFDGLKDKPGVGVFPNGVKYVVASSGKGPRPTETDSISLNLIARLPDGTVVEDTYQAKKPFSATPASFFPGLKATLQEMPEGSKWTIFVPSAMAYGDKGTTLIPPFSALVLEVELILVKPQKK